MKCIGSSAVASGRNLEGLFAKALCLTTKLICHAKHHIGALEARPSPLASACEPESGVPQEVRSLLSAI